MQRTRLAHALATLGLLGLTAAMGTAHAQALAAVVPTLVNTVQAFSRQGFAPLQQRFAARDALTGRAVSLSDGTQGTVQGVAADGALQVQTAAGVVSVTSSEISVRPQLPVQG